MALDAQNLLDQLLKLKEENGTLEGIEISCYDINQDRQEFHPDLDVFHNEEFGIHSIDLNIIRND